jgi:hypothetical protein
MSKITKRFGQEEIAVVENMQSEDNNNLDVNLIIASFQEKISQLITEVVVKEATIKQLSLTIEKMRGKM